MKIYVFGSSSVGNCYLARFENGKNILLECGISIKTIISKLMEIKLSLNDISFCILSHIHTDHSLAKDDLIKRGIRIVEYDYQDSDISVWSIPVNHGKTPCNAYIIACDSEKLFFGTDFISFVNTSDLKKVLTTPFNKIMIECNFSDELIEKTADLKKVLRQKNTHMSLRGCIKYLTNMNLKKCNEIFLMHLSDGYADELQMQSLIYYETKIPTRICKKLGGVS